LDPLIILYCLLLGAVVGLLAGLLGIGGGMVMVPFLMQILAGQGLGSENLVKVAIATSLTTILFTSMSSVRAQHRAGAIRWDLVRGLAPGMIVGALVGAQFAGVLPARLLELLFGLFLLYMAYNMLVGKRVVGKHAANGAGNSARLPGALGMAGIGSLIGALSAMVGAGGGFLTVPILTQRGVQIQKAVACSAACGFPIALAGAVGYIWAGRHLQLAPATVGYLYLPGLAVISIASVITAPIGVRTAHRISAAKLKTVFGVLLLAIAGYMLYKATGR
jgi:uncharacterized protein